MVRRALLSKAKKKTATTASPTNSSQATPTCATSGGINANPTKSGGADGGPPTPPDVCAQCFHPSLEGTGRLGGRGFPPWSLRKRPRRGPEGTRHQGESGRGPPKTGPGDEPPRREQQNESSTHFVNGLRIPHRTLRESPAYCKTGDISFQPHIADSFASILTARVTIFQTTPHRENQNP